MDCSMGSLLLSSAYNSCEWLRGDSSLQSLNSGLFKSAHASLVSDNRESSLSTISVDEALPLHRMQHPPLGDRDVDSLASLGEPALNDDEAQEGSVSIQLSMASDISESSLVDTEEEASSSWNPFHYIGKMVCNWVGNMTPEQRQGWIDRIRNWEFTATTAVRKQAIYNSYKFTLKALLFVAGMQMPVAMNAAFAMIDVERRMNSLKMLHNPQY
ncbi:hypothetical protein [Sansalvadorimonas verongulae]|uniref:hypothetical protein n=1 Tax=Sansalvadorimonas verongulae TaxID=2172824 RepID=UPI0012BBC774|nr:hypothetical protein [Sansalvadorimonas verongulae]MTI14029.1 hypothetical protein [Sansalvadorimonas verongulae]